MAKGYWVARISVKDPDIYPQYVEAAKVAFQKYGARFLARGGRFKAVEGEGRDRNVIIEFETYEHALACYRSPEYQIAVAIRQACAEGEIVVVEGIS